MSRGIAIFYKVISKDHEKITYGYSGANINKEYEENHLLEYDGIIEITIHALINKDIVEAFADNEITILKECRYEWHEPRLTDGEDSIGFFAIKIIYKIFQQYKKRMQIIDSGSVVF